MKSTLLPIQILLSIFSPTLRHRFEENAIWEKDYPEIKALMSSDDKRECHQQFKDIQDPQLHSDLIGLSIVNLCNYLYTLISWTCSMSF